MNKRIIDFLKKTYDKKIDGTGLAFFRIMYSIVLMGEIIQLFYFKELIYDKIPFIDVSEINFSIPIIIWSISVLLILFGFFTRYAAILNYLLTVILVGTVETFEYHVFYAYLGINFAFIFLPISKCLSLDRLIEKLKYSNTTFQYNPTKNVRQIYYYIIPFVGLALVYSDLVFYKLSSEMWLNGLGSWLPSSLPMITHVNTDFLLNQEYFMKIMGWLTIAFEFIFIFVFFRKKWRLPILIFGLILHTGILIQFPIPFFALTAIVIYILMVPVSFWKKIFYPNNKKKQNFFFYYDSECPLCVRTKITISHFDWFNKIGFKIVQLDAKDHEELAKKDTQVLLDDIHSVNVSKNKVYFGIDTYLQVFKRIFYLYPLYIILSIPGIYHLAKKIYSFIAKNRNVERCTEENCGYNPPVIPNIDDVKILKNLTVSKLKRTLIIYSLIAVTFLQIGIIYNHGWLVQDAKKLVGFDR